MTLRRLVFLLVAYVALDFSNPMLPGAVTFDPDRSTEGVRLTPVGIPTPSAAVLPDVGVPGTRPVTEARRSGAPRLVSAPLRWTVHVRRAPAFSADPAPAAEDH